ncbi:hypothetical protein HPB50_012552 [Hyalomma asiaticum]|uniref:Uncharacterized protein n=1 Tax=Hyalomma asiaticum TaxID=266040 RepID=A0ACB7RID7_HYAAI|nr:hypothetical protein HPB50_012552 [Hyalomma asiaticum]
MSSTPRAITNDVLVCNDGKANSSGCPTPMFAATARVSDRQLQKRYVLRPGARSRVNMTCTNATAEYADASVPRAAASVVSLQGPPPREKVEMDASPRQWTRLQYVNMDVAFPSTTFILMILTYYTAHAVAKSSRAKDTEKFDLCEEKFNRVFFFLLYLWADFYIATAEVVQMAKGARIGARMLESCAMMLVARYGPRAIGIQRCNGSVADEDEVERFFVKEL